MSDHDEVLDKLYWLAREARPEATQHDVNQAVATIRHALEQRDMERSLPPEAACPNIEVLENGEHVCALEQRRVPENESLESVANRVCRDIPDDCEISLCMEWGAGFVTLTKAGRYVNLPDAAEKSLVEQINDALAAARNPEQEDKDDE